LEGGGVTQLPFLHIWPSGQTAPVQALTHVPPWQTSPAGHDTVAQSGSTQCPARGPSVSQVSDGMHAGQGHASVHAPFSQTCPIPQPRPLHGSTQFPLRHTCPIGHVTPAQSLTHDPPWQCSPDGQVTVRQSVSTQ
jgi:hypothetical protein